MQEFLIFLNQHLSLSLAVCMVAVLLLIMEMLRAKRNTFNITPSQLTQLINRQNAAVIDIRHRDAFRNGHIIGAQSLAAHEIQKNPKKLEKYRKRPVIIVAGNAAESQKIALTLLKQGYNASSLSGGIRAWQDAQMPLVKE